ncbi:hypothetical protein [Kineobactrum sediminis]|nr:hypothetical protein [Kineobactrum sediminis]
MKASATHLRRAAIAVSSVLAITLLVTSSVAGDLPGALLAAAMIPLLIAADWWRPDQVWGTPNDLDTVAVIDSVKAFNEFGVLLNSELMHVEEEIERTRSMIQHAASDLSTHFHQLHDLSADLAHTVQETLGPNPDGVDTKDAQVAIERVLETVAKNQPQLEHAVAASVRSLQFEDLSLQALSEAQRSLAYLRQVAGILQQIHDTGELAASIHQQHEIWVRARRKPVSQKNLDEGLAELF